MLRIKAGMSRRTVGALQVQFLDKVFFMPVVVLHVVFWSRQCIMGGSAVAVHPPCCFAEADSHGPGCSGDHLHSTVAAH